MGVLFHQDSVGKFMFEPAYVLLFTYDDVVEILKTLEISYVLNDFRI